SGLTCTGCCGPPSAPRPFSLSGLPIANTPPGIGSISNDTSSVTFSTKLLCVAFSTTGSFAGGWPGAAGCQNQPRHRATPAKAIIQRSGCFIAWDMCGMLQVMAKHLVFFLLILCGGLGGVNVIARAARPDVELSTF